jgi:uncharacterized protein
MSYTDEALDHLDTLLQALPQEPLPMTLSELNGYLTGILASKSLISPSEWLPGIWSDDGASTLPEVVAVEATIQAVMAHYNNTAALINGGGWIEPIYEEDVNSGETLWEPWVDGFVRAMQLREAEWLAIANGQASDAQMAVNMLFMMQEIYEGSSDLSEDEIANIDNDAPDLIPDLVAMILSETRGIDPFAEDDTAETGVVMPFRAPKLPGGNDPCPCGSGRKYKACCGRN